jgi:putative PIN family toxin of toxin-antitoxin system
VRIVLDTNVFVSGAFFGGHPYRILSAWRDSHLTLVLSAEILDEYRRAGEDLAERYPGVELAPFLRLLVGHAEFVEPEPLPSAVCRDPDDDQFLACATAGGAQAIVSGDKHLLSLSEFRSIPILTPKQLVELHLPD